jgi:protocatechuate 3,4-dioxygenase beta subunit
VLDQEIDDGRGVALRGAEQRTERAVMTDDEGRFTLTNLPAGRYSLSATKPSYVTAFFGSRRPGRGPGTPLALTAGPKAEGLTLHMARGGVIAGQVLDETGQPFLNAQVRVLQYRTLNGERQLVPPVLSGGLNAGFGQTDDRGRFRIFGLMPGAYVVSVAAVNRGNDIRQLSTSDVQAVVADLKMPPPRQPGGGAAPAPDTKPLGGRTVGFAPVYYPGTTVATDASEVNVAAGQEVNGIDFQLRLVPTSKVQGTVLGPDGQPRPGVQLLIVPTTQSVEFAMGSTSMSRTAPDGKFSTGNLPPGRYTISARSGASTQLIEMGGGATFFSAERLVAGGGRGGPPPETAKPLWAQQDIDVNGVDITDLSLTLQEGVTVTGKLVFDGKSMAAPEDLIRVRLSLLPAVPGRMTLGAPAAKINADGTFAIEGITPGAYRLNANVPSTGFSAQSPWTIKSAVANGKDVIDAPLTVQPGADVGAVTVTFTDQSTELSGKVTDPAGEPVSDLTILVFPTDRSMWTPTSRRMRPPSQPGSDGMFKVTGLPPGEYFLAAVTDLEQNDWGDPGFMEQVAAAALKLTIGEGEKKVQNLRIGG